MRLFLPQTITLKHLHDAPTLGFYKLK